MRRLFVARLPQATTIERLSTYFSRWGPVASVKIAVESRTGRSRGFGWIDFDEPEDAARAARHVHELHGRTLDVKFATRTEDEAPRASSKARRPFFEDA